MTSSAPKQETPRTNAAENDYLIWLSGHGNICDDGWAVARQLERELNALFASRQGEAGRAQGLEEAAIMMECGMHCGAEDCDDCWRARQIRGLASRSSAPADTVTCDRCAFRYGAEHRLADGTYKCPVCELAERKSAPAAPIVCKICDAHDSTGAYIAYCQRTDCPFIPHRLLRRVAERCDQLFDATGDENLGQFAVELRQLANAPATSASESAPEELVRRIDRVLNGYGSTHVIAGDIIALLKDSRKALSRPAAPSGAEELVRHELIDHDFVDSPMGCAVCGEGNAAHRAPTDNLILRMLNTAKFSDTVHPPAGALLREAVARLRSLISRPAADREDAIVKAAAALVPFLEEGWDAEDEPEHQAAADAACDKLIAAVAALSSEPRS